MYKKINKIKWYYVLILLLCFLGMMFAMRFYAGQVKQVSGGIEILDLNFGNTVSTIRQTILSLGENGRRSYLNFFIIDGFYAITYTLFYCTAILFLLSKIGMQKKILYALGLLPIIGMLFDWSENILFGISVKNWYDVLLFIYKASNICTICKFIFVYFSLLLVVVMLVFLVIRYMKRRKENNYQR